MTGRPLPNIEVSPAENDAQRGLESPVGPRPDSEHLSNTTGHSRVEFRSRRARGCHNVNHSTRSSRIPGRSPAETYDAE
jgi:hypothetical protein